CLQYNSAPPTF
nr:immunoglobulin light chain junction region [Macaca mulatta]